MTPQMVAEEMTGLESLAVAEVDRQCRRLLGPQKLWLAEDWDWFEARIDRVHSVFHGSAL